MEGRHRLIHLNLRKSEEIPSYSTLCILDWSERIPVKRSSHPTISFSSVGTTSQPASAALYSRWLILLLVLQILCCGGGQTSYFLFHSLPESSLMRTTNLGELCRICCFFLSLVPFQWLGGWMQSMSNWFAVVIGLALIMLLLLGIF